MKVAVDWVAAMVAEATAGALAGARVVVGKAAEEMGGEATVVVERVGGTKVGATEVVEMAAEVAWLVTAVLVGGAAEGVVMAGGRGAEAMEAAEAPQAAEMVVVESAVEKVVVTMVAVEVGRVAEAMAAAGVSMVEREGATAVVVAAPKGVRHKFRAPAAAAPMR